MKTLALKVIAACRTFGPYLAIELLLPGGSLLALLLWLYRTYARPANFQAGGRDSDESRLRFPAAGGNHDDLVTPGLAADCVACLDGTANSPRAAQRA